jgi:hypothetical protein
VPRHQLVVSNVDQQVVLEEALNLGQVLDRGERLAGGGRQGHGGHHDARLVVVGDCVLCKVADLRDAKLLVRQKLDPDGAAVGHGVGVGGCGGRSVFAEHGVAGTGGELKFGAAVFGCMLAFPYFLCLYGYCRRLLDGKNGAEGRTLRCRRGGSTRRGTVPERC